MPAKMITGKTYFLRRSLQIRLQLHVFLHKAKKNHCTVSDYLDRNRCADCRNRDFEASEAELVEVSTLQRAIDILQACNVPLTPWATRQLDCPQRVISACIKEINIVVHVYTSKKRPCSHVPPTTSGDTKGRIRNASCVVCVQKACFFFFDEIGMLCRVVGWLWALLIMDPRFSLCVRHRRFVFFPWTRCMKKRGTKNN